MHKRHAAVISKENRSYFYGANTSGGFVLTPDESVAEEYCDRSIIIKGAPGSGKNTLMRRFAS